MMLGFPDESPVEGPEQLAARIPSVRVQILHRLPDRERGGSGWQRVAKTDRDRVREIPGDFLEEPAFFKTKNTSPDAVEADRDDRRVEALHDPFKAAPEREELTNPRDLSFSENNDHFTIADRLARDVERLDHLTRMLLR